MCVKRGNRPAVMFDVFWNSTQTVTSGSTNSLLVSLLFSHLISRLVTSFIHFASRRQKNLIHDTGILTDIPKYEPVKSHVRCP
jgi:hypothetical protein